MSVKSNSVQKLQWQETEIQQFFAYYELYGNDFHSYTQHLNRTYSQIKSFFHNWLRKQPDEIQLKYNVGPRGGSHKAYRNNISVNDQKSKSRTPIPDLLAQIYNVCFYIM
ncbi:SANT/Myb_domain [Hexamita inflata]|uniref:SANT/Myb domain n=1 Tax=Hexamita inflata TaxID=28002 RepID=A0AA86NZS9_9EUKA|nr:SANT/Myb domain [Hexamita inflata]